MTNLQDMFDNNSAHKFYSASKETCAKMSATLKGRIVSEETRAKMSAARKGKPVHSDKSRAKMSAARKGKPIHSDKSRAKISAEKCKSIITPYGQFPSRLAALKHMKQIGILNAAYKLFNFLKTDPDQYYYIKECQK